MEGQTEADETNNIQKEAANEAADNPQSKEVSFRDLIWVKIHGSSWWPSQVVDEETVSDFNKPSKKSSGDVLVRLYGSYKYLYVNCDKSRVEFEKVLEENNGSYDEIFSKSLEEDLSRLKSGRSKRKGSKSKANSKEKTLNNNEGAKQRGSKKKLFDNGTPKRTSSRLSDVKTKPTEVKKSDSQQQKPENASTKKRKNRADKKLEPNTPESATTTSAVSERKVKVLQSLGLLAPTGSPFRQNGPTLPSSDPC